MSDKGGESDEQPDQKEKDQSNEKMYQEVEHGTRSTEREPASARNETASTRNENSANELKRQGLPDISIVDEKLWPPECKPADVEDSGPPYYKDDVSVIAMGDDHAGNHWDGYKNALDKLSEEGLTHVALEMIPNDLNGPIREYRELKDKLKDADDNDRAALEKNVEELRGKIRNGIEALIPEDKSSFPPGMMNADDLIKMIDMAHEKNADVVGIEPEANKLAAVMESLKNDTDKDGKPIGTGLRDEAKQTFLDYFKTGSSDDERKSARDTLEKYLSAKFPEAKAAEYLKWLDDAKKEGLETAIDAKFPNDGKKGFADLGKSYMNWRDGVFAREIEKLTEKGAKVFVMAGSGHFTKSVGLCDAFKEFRKGVTTLAEHLGKRMGHIRSGLRRGQ